MRRGACVPVLMLLGPYEIPEKLHRGQAPSVLGSDHVLGLGEFTACLSGDLTRQVVLFMVKKSLFAWQSPEVAPSRCSWGLLGSTSSIPPLLLLQHTWNPAWPHPDLAGVWMWAQLSASPACLPCLLSLIPACAQPGTAAINYGNSCVIYMSSPGSAAPGMGGIFLVEPCCPLLQMPFCQQVFNWAFIVRVILEVMKRVGKSEPAACPPSPLLGSGLDAAVKASEIPSGAVVPCLRHRAFIPQAGGGKTITLHPDLNFFNEPSEGHICPHPRVFGGEAMGLPSATPGTCSPVIWCCHRTRP